MIVTAEPSVTGLGVADRETVGAGLGRALAGPTPTRYSRRPSPCARVNHAWTSYVVPFVSVPLNGTCALRFVNAVCDTGAPNWSGTQEPGWFPDMPGFVSLTRQRRSTRDTVQLGASQVTVRMPLPAVTWLFGADTCAAAGAAENSHTAPSSSARTGRRERRARERPVGASGPARRTCRSGGGRLARAGQAPGALHAAGRWPLAAGRWPLAAGRWPLAAGRWPLAAGRWPLAAGRWPLAAGKLYTRVSGADGKRPCESATSEFMTGTPIPRRGRHASRRSQHGTTSSHSAGNPGARPFPGTARKAGHLSGIIVTHFIDRLQPRGTPTGDKPRVAPRWRLESYRKYSFSGR